jgi:predicted dehydrogenase
LYRVKIHGAGSIGNHLAHAARSLGWDVVVCDVSDQALERMRNDIYPSRYGRWDSAIRLCDAESAPKGGFDLILIGTPPPSHVTLALQAIEEGPKAVSVEKPLCPPSLELAQELYEASCRSETKVFVGYDHVVGKAAQKAEELISSGAVGQVQSIDVEFREHWGGIFAAHPWLSGPGDSYLGSWQQGGGASGEHSHGINLWQHFAHAAGKGRVAEVDAMVRYSPEDAPAYDSVCLINLQTESGMIGRVVQDVITLPPSKRARVQGDEGVLEWVNAYNPQGDAVLVRRTGQAPEEHLVAKTRPDDFIEELRHLEAQVSGAGGDSGIRLERGLDTMLVVAAVHLSERTRSRIKIDYSRGYTPEALCPSRN